METEEATHTEHVCFKVDGEFLTDLCRDLVTEGKWRHALRILTEGVSDFGHENALDVLRGKSKLVGVNDVELVAEDRTAKRDAYLDLLAWQYAGCWQRPDGLWQPYAKVISFCRDDMPKDVPRIAYGSYQVSSRWAAQRVLYYADDARDRVFDESPQTIWRKVEDPPLWFAGCKSAIEAIDDLRARGRYLEERGAFGSRSLIDQLAEASTLDLEELDSDFAEQVGQLEDLLSDQHSFGLEEMTRDALGEKGVEALKAIMGTDRDHDAAPEPDPECKSEGGYILPNGQFYGCGYMDHASLALDLLRLMFNVEQPKDPQKEADRRNWLRIQPSALLPGKFEIMSPKDRPTKAQEKTLADWCIAHQQQYPEHLRR